MALLGCKLGGQEKMAKKLTVVANGQPFSAYPGDMLLDAALLQGIDLTHAVAPASAAAVSSAYWEANSLVVKRPSPT